MNLSRSCLIRRNEGSLNRVCHAEVLGWDLKVIHVLSLTLHIRPTYTEKASKEAFAKKKDMGLLKDMFLARVPDFHQYDIFSD